jgi:hypothetical protein
MSRANGAPLRSQIEAAWRDATYPGDDRIATPTYCDEGIAAYFRGRTWQGHQVAALRYHSEGLSFFTPEAFCYYLAAYMIAVIEDAAAADVICDGILFHLSPVQLGHQWADKYRERLAGFSVDQRRAITAYLAWRDDERYPSKQVAATIAYLETGEVEHASGPLDRLLQLAGCADRPHAQIDSLRLSYTTVQDADLAAIGELPALRELSLSGATITDAGLALVAAAPKLEVLDLSGCDRITPAGLAALGGGLAELDLSNIDLDDDGLRALAPLKLRRFQAANARRVTAAGWASFDVERLEIARAFAVGVSTELLARIGRAGKIRRLEIKALDDDGLVALSAAATLAELEVSDASRVTDRGLAALAQVPALRSLTLGQLAASRWPAGFPALAALTLLDIDLRSSCADGLGRLPALAELRIFGARFEAGALAAVARLPRLHELTLHCSRLSDAVLAELAGARLISLSASFASADGGLAVLARLTALTRLKLDGFTAFDAAQVAALARSPSLRELVMQDMPLTDDELAGLAACRALSSLRLASTKVTPHGLAAFRAAHPTITVIDS